MFKRVLEHFQLFQHNLLQINNKSVWKVLEKLSGGNRSKLVCKSSLNCMRVAPKHLKQTLIRKSPLGSHLRFSMTLKIATKTTYKNRSCKRAFSHKCMWKFQIISLLPFKFSSIILPNFQVNAMYTFRINVKSLQIAGGS